MRTAGIRKAQRPGHFIISFTYGIIAGAADDPEIAFPLHAHQLGMSTGHNQGHAGILQFLDQPVGINMPGDMMCANERLVPGQRQAFGGYNTNQQRPD
ncbi:hypothetical protein D3C81_1921280 [compost metagenome]